MNQKIILLTGASGFLGRAIIENNDSNKNFFILIDRKSKKFTNFVTFLKKNKYNFIKFETDFQNLKQITELTRKIRKKFKLIDVIINNAAFTGDEKLKGWNVNFQKQSADTFMHCLTVNLIAPFVIIRDLSNLLNKSKYQSIINIGSIYADIAPKNFLYKDLKMNNPAAYGSSKAGLLYLTKWFSVNLGPQIRVNMISPGGIERSQDNKFIKRYESVTPLRRMAKETDILGIIEFLSSNDSKYITGQNIKVDGGFTN